MFFVLPSMAVFGIYFIAAVLPAIILMRYVYQQDKCEKEPPWLLRSLVLMGVLAALLSMVLERIGKDVLNHLLSSDNPAYTIILAFLVVAAVEEGTKFLLLNVRTWNDSNFNYRFDGIVYAVFISLGFAAFENILYVFGYGLSVSLARALLSIPGHMGFAVFMGIFYGNAKECESYGNTVGKVANLFASYFVAVFLHGFYDACAMSGTVLATVLFTAFVIVMYIVVFRLIKKASDTDRPI